MQPLTMQLLASSDLIKGLTTPFPLGDTPHQAGAEAPLARA